MQPTDEQINEMYAEHIADDVKLALSLKAQELVIKTNGATLWIHNHTIQILTDGGIWVNVENLTRVKVTKTIVGVYDNNFDNAVHIDDVQNIIDVYWEEA